MRTIETDLIEKILFVNDKLIKFANENIFNNTRLTPSQFNILWEIISNNWLKINDLKQKLIISAPALSQTLGRMEKSELIIRVLSKEDKRETVIKASKKWEELYNKLNKEYISLSKERLKNISKEEIKNMLHILDNIEKTIKS